MCVKLGIPISAAGACDRIIDETLVMLRESRVPYHEFFRRLSYFPNRVRALFVDDPKLLSMFDRWKALCIEHHVGLAFSRSIQQWFRLYPTSTPLRRRQ